MTDRTLPDFIIAGTPKCATTWLYECLRDHPEVFMPDIDHINYFDMYYHRGTDWYADYFTEYAGETVVGEETPPLIHMMDVPKRIHDTVPDVDLFFALRNPIDRAFSLYWHLKSRYDGLQVDFRRAIEEHPMYQIFVIPGFYHYHLSRFREYFDEEQIHLLFFDDLVEDERQYVRGVYEELGVDDDYVPAPIGETVNEARGMPYSIQRASMWVSANAPSSVVRGLRPIYDAIDDLLVSHSEYDDGPPRDVAEELVDIYREDIRALEDYADRDLSHWLEVE